MSSDRAVPPVFSVAVTAGPDGRTIVAVAGEVDLTSADELSAAVRDALAAGDVLLDLHEVTFLDSGGVRILNAALREAAERGRDLRVADELHPHVVQVLELTGMLALLPRESDR